MIKVYNEISLEDFEAWSGAVNTLERVKDCGKCDELEAIIEELYPDGIDEGHLNDLLRFEDDWIYETLNINDDDDEDEDDDDDDEE